MKRAKLCSVLCVLLLAVLLVTALPLRAEAASASGTHGSNLTWTLNSSGTLTISGTGSMTSYYTHPWSSYASSIKKVVINSGVTSIGYYAFQNCTALTSVTIPSTVTTIGQGAFYGCSALTSITIPNKVTSIDSFAFSHCTALKKVTLPASVTSIGSYAFASCSALTNVYITDLSAWLNIDFADYASNPLNEADNLYINNTLTTHIVIPAGTTEIKPFAFYNFDGMTDLTLPSSVSAIGNYAFYMCSSLKNAYISDMDAWCAIDFANYYANPMSQPNGINLYLDDTLVTSVSYPEGTTAVKNHTFCNYRHLTSVSLPDTITSIGASAFSSCTKLNSVAIPDAVTSIGASAFFNCTRLKSVTIPASVSTIGNSAFYGCTALSNVTFQGSAPTFGTNVFYNVTANVDYTVSDETWTEEVRAADYGGTLTWVPRCAYADHISDKVVTGATCTIQGFTENTCTICALEYVDSYVEPLGHDYVDYVCTRCGATDSDYAGSFSTGVKWLIKEGTLIVYGEGDIPSYSSSAFPWYSYRSSIKRLVIKEGITRISSYAFYGMLNLEEIYYDAACAADMLTRQDLAVYGTYAFWRAGYNSGGVDVTFGPHVTRLPSALFMAHGVGGDYQANIVSVTFEEGCRPTSVGEYAFFLYSSQLNVYISDLDWWTSVQFENSESNPLMYADSFYVDGQLLTAYTLSTENSIGTYTFAGYDLLTSVTIPDGITSLNDGLFYGCTGLTEVTLPESLTALGVELFYGCTGLTNVRLPEGIAEIPSRLFQNCNSLTSVTIPDGVTSIGDCAFWNCTGLTQVTIPESVAAIGSYSFYGCTALTEITIPENMTSIGSYAFFGCSELENIWFNATAMTDLGVNDCAFGSIGTSGNGTTITFGANVTRVPANLFYPGNNSSNSTPNLVRVEFAEGSVCESIGERAFCGCYTLTSAQIPESVTTIDSSAFASCTALTSLVIPVNVTSIGSNAFYNCAGLTELFFNAAKMPDLTSGHNIFKNAASASGGFTVAFGNQVTRVPANLFYTYSNVDHLPVTSITFEDGSVCSSIGQYAFSYCDRLTSVQFPATLTDIEESAFYYCEALTDVYIEDLTAWCSINFNSSNPLTYAEHLYVNGTLTTELVIPEGTTGIGSYAFYNCKAITAVTIPESVTSISGYAFSGCSNLEKIQYNAVSAEDLTPSSNTFRNAGSNSSGIAVTISRNVKSIPAYLFKSCPNLVSVTFEDGSVCETVGSYAFQNCSTLTDVYAPDLETWCSINFNSGNPLVYAEHLYLGGELVTEVTITGIAFTGNNTFNGYVGLTSVTIGDDITSIGEYAFSSCSSLSSVTIGNGVTSIGTKAFYGCTALTSINIPKSVTTFGESVFWNCTGLTEITFQGAPPTNGRTFTGVTATAFYPANSGWTEEIMTNLSGTITWVPYCPLKAHDFGPYTSNGDATCTADGTASAYCTFCGEEDRQPDPGSMLSHSYSGGSCTLCGKSKPIANGICGKNLTWELDSNYHLTISGTGDMFHYSNNTKDQPWNEYQYEIASITVGEGVTAIGAGAFSGCTAVKTLSLPGTLTSIGDRAFFYCTTLPEVTFPENLVQIGEMAFYGCWAITELEIPASVTEIGSEAFGFMDGLESFCVAEDNPRFCTDASGVLFDEDRTALIFAPEYLSGSYTVPSTVRTLSDHAFFSCGKLSSVKLPDNLVSIGEWAFGSCKKLSTITIPASVTYIGANAFNSCQSMYAITVEEGNAAYMNDSQGALYTKDQTRLLWASAVSGDYVIPDTVTEIGAYAFSGNTALTGVTIPAGIRSIGSLAFDSCTSLNEVKFLGNAPEIDSYAFYEVIADVYYPLGNDTWTSAVRQNYEGTLSWIAYDPTIVDCGDCGGDLTWELNTDGVLTISGTGAMDHYSAGSAPWHAYEDQIRMVVIQKGVTSVGDYAFSECSALTEVTFPETVTTIGSYSFYNCDALAAITLPRSVTSIGKYALAYCNKLTRIIFLGDAPSIGKYAFRNLTATCCYPGATSSWVISAMASYGGTITWAIHCLSGHSYEQGVCIRCGDKTAYVEAPVMKSSRSASTGKVTLKWNAVDGAKKYNVSYSTDGETWSNLKSGVTNTSLTHGSAKIGTTYYYCVTAVDASGNESEMSNVVSGTRRLAQPVVSLTNVASSGKIKISWEKVDGASGYNIYRSTSENGTYTRIKSNYTGTSLTNSSGITAGKTYYYKVIALYSKSAGNSVYSAPKSLTCKLARPVVTLSNVASTGKIKISWEKVDGATGYNIYRSTSKNGTYTRIKSNYTGTSLTNSSGITAGKTYYYRVEAVCSNSSGNSAQSEAVSLVCKLAQPVVTLSNVSSSGKIKISWEPVDGAVGYNIYRSTKKNSGYTRIKSNYTGTSLTNSSAEAGTKYYYKVVAVCKNSEGNSAYSEVKSLMCKLARPDVTVTRNSNGKPVLKWDKVSGAESYTVYYSTDGGKTYKVLKSGVTKLTLTHSKATAGTTYTYYVQAVHSNTDANSAKSVKDTIKSK